MATKELPSAEALRKLFDYNPATGRLTWRPRLGNHHRFNTRYANGEAGNISGDGYRYVSIRKERYLAHRIIWMMVHGEAPDQIDHINGDRLNNRLHNLRSVSEAENHRNMKLPATNTSGVIGVIPDTRYGGWIAQIKIKGRMKYLGKFYDLDAAAAARKKAELEYGFHPNHGRAA